MPAAVKAAAGHVTPAEAAMEPAVETTNKSTVESTMETGMEKWRTNEQRKAKTK